ncbi:YlbG family protein [Secundilactobacillus yichangensis]|uniref:YlbG family protein n=1 Tax=Secundilactobacillus yichangensis TaxID=2799580 RepID=UPI00194316B3|nr:YlbG family protein [Secundilactobacillus yichangensis]
MDIQSRTSLVVYVSSLRQVRQLKRYGHLEYVSKRMRYAIIYVNEEDAKETISRLKQLRFVKRIIESPRNELMDLLGLSGEPEAKDDQINFEEDEE